MYMPLLATAREFSSFLQQRVQSAMAQVLRLVKKFDMAELVSNLDVVVHSGFLSSFRLKCKQRSKTLSVAPRKTARRRWQPTDGLV